MSKLIHLLLFISLVAIGTFVCGISQAMANKFHKTHTLKGNYGLTMTRHCSGEISGTNFWEGVLHYEKDGTGVFTGMRQRAAFLQDELTCPFTYTPNADGSFTQNMDCTGTLVASLGLNPPIGGTHADIGIVLKGRILKTFRSRGLVFGDTDLNEETFVGVSGVNFTRICGASGTAVRIK